MARRINKRKEEVLLKKITRLTIIWNVKKINDSDNKKKNKTLQTGKLINRKEGR
jgi:hypothetical protein